MDAEDLVSLMEEFLKTLHPRHGILTELRSRLIAKMGKGDFALKQRLCLENLAVVNIIDPGFSPTRCDH